MVHALQWTSSQITYAQEWGTIHVHDCILTPSQK